MANEVAIRRAIAPATPLTLELEGEQGKFILNVKLAFDFNAFSRIEAKTGANIFLGNIFSNLNATNTVVLFWAALQRHNPEYAGDEGLEVVGTYLTIENAPIVANALKNAFLASLSKDSRAAIEKAEKGAEKPADPQSAAPVQE